MSQVSGMVDNACVALFVLADLPKLKAWEAACMAHPAVSGTIHPPDSNKSYMDQMFETYQKYIAERKAAAAKQ